MKTNPFRTLAAWQPAACDETFTRADSPKPKMRLFIAFSLWLLILVHLGLTGCVSKSQAKLRQREAFIQGQQQAIAAQQQQQQPAVWFRGLVRNPRVAWTEDLTLAQALLAAQYTGALQPHTVTVIRQGQRHAIDTRRLLRGQEDPVLEPGDVIEVR